MKKKIAVLSSTMLLFGCAMLSGLFFFPDYSQLKEYYKKGDYENAIIAVTPKDMPEFDVARFGMEAALVGMEAGTVALTAKKFSDSIRYFDMADRENYLSQSYKPKYFDGIMVSTYKGIAYWAQGDLENATVAFNNVHRKQQLAGKDHEEEIAKAREDAEKYSEEFLAVANTLNEEYDVFKEFKPYADFTNPYSTYMFGLYNLTASNDKNEVENAVNFFRKADAMVSNKYVKADIQMAEDVANGKTVEPTVWLVYEEGLVAELSSKTIRIPFPTKSGIKLVKFELPTFNPQPHSYNTIKASTSNGQYETQMLVDMDRVIKTEYNARYWTEVINGVVRAAISIAAQEVTSQAINKSSWAKKLDKKMAKHGGIIGDLGKNKLGSRAISSATSVAMAEVFSYSVDIEQWATLPKEVHLARFNMPANRKVSLLTPNGQQLADVKIDEKIKNAIIYVRLPVEGGNPTVFVIDANGDN